jgi:hypothetical protein
MAASLWVQMTLLILVDLVPFAAAGIFLGHRLTVDSIGPVMGGLTALLSILGGAWFPISSSGVMYDIAQVLPSYWLVQASHIAVGGAGVGRRGLARDGRLGGGDDRPRRPRLPARHEAGLALSLDPPFAGRVEGIGVVSV